MYSYKMTVKGSVPFGMFRTMVNMINHGLRSGTSDFDLKNKLKGYLPPKEISGFLTVVKEYYMLDKLKGRYILHPTHSFIANQISERYGKNAMIDPLDNSFEGGIITDSLVINANDIITASALNNAEVRTDIFDRKWIGMIMSNLSNNAVLPLTSGTERGIATFRNPSDSKTSFITRKFFTKEGEAGWAASTDVTTFDLDETPVSHISKNNIFCFTEVNKYGFYQSTDKMIETIDFHSIMRAPNLIDLILTFMSDKGFKIKF